MWLRTTYKITELYIHADQVEELRFELSDGAVVVLRPVDEGDQEYLAAALCTAMFERDPAPSVLAVFEGLAEGRLPDQAVESMRIIGQTPPTGDDFHTGLIPIGILPNDFQEFVIRAEADLDDLVMRAVRVFRWRHRRPGPDQDFAYMYSDWSLDKVTWRQLPRSRPTYYEEITNLGLAVTQGEAVQDLLNAGADEPLGFQLWREAVVQRHSNPRSSLVIGVAAAEVGFKEFAMELQPETRWLLENVPSPPLVPMLKNYLPTLPVRQTIRGRALPPPNRVRKTIAEAVEYRNKVAHLWCTNAKLRHTARHP